MFVVHPLPSNNLLVVLSRNCSQDSELAASQAQESIDLLQKKVWSLEALLEEKDMAFKMLQVLLPECQLKEKEHLEFKKLLGEEQIARAQRAVSLTFCIYIYMQYIVH